MKYKEEIITGNMTKYRKSGSGYFYNGDTPQITFNIDEIVTLPDGTSYTTEGVDSVTATMSDPTEVFNLLNPSDDTIIGTAKFQDVFVMLYSLFFHGTAKKDAPPPSLPPTV